jgi:hypothetical protein
MISSLLLEHNFLRNDVSVSILEVVGKHCSDTSLVDGFSELVHISEHFVFHIELGNPVYVLFQFEHVKASHEVVGQLDVLSLVSGNSVLLFGEIHNESSFNRNCFLIDFHFPVDGNFIANNKASWL